MTDGSTAVLWEYIRFGSCFVEIYAILLELSRLLRSCVAKVSLICLKPGMMLYSLGLLSARQLTRWFNMFMLTTK